MKRPLDHIRALQSKRTCERPLRRGLRGPRPTTGSPEDGREGSLRRERFRRAFPAGPSGGGEARADARGGRRPPRAVMDVQFGVNPPSPRPPLVQTARPGGVVRNFKHQVVCQNSGEKI